MPTMIRPTRSGWRAALALIACSAVMSWHPAPAAAEDKPARTIALTGTGTVSARPDTAHVSSGVVSDAGSADKALADNTQAMTRIIARLKALGMAGKDIQTANFSVSPRYSRATASQPRTIIGYRVTNSVRITVRDLNKLGAVLDQAVQSGSNQAGGIVFSVSNAENLKDTAREAAMADAMRKAKLYVTAAGAKLGPVVTISENFISPQPRPMMARMAAEQKGAVPIEPGEQRLEVRVNVTWEIK